jgi:hypothetical protein
MTSRLADTRVDCSQTKAVMSRSVRQFLFASLIACHAAVTLCGPCLHELPGLSHKMGAASQPHGSDDPISSRGDSADRCLVCQCLAQGQLPVEFSGVSSAQVIDELVIPAIRVTPHLSHPLPTFPRAPPKAVSGLS